MNRQQLANKISIVHWRVRHKIRRYREAIAYARNRLSMTQANDIIYNCQPPQAGNRTGVAGHCHRPKIAVANLLQR
jgi:hypothetical protein